MKLPTGKAAGIDNVSNEMIKYAAPAIIETLTLLFNRIYEDGVYPKEWGKTYISPLHKKGDRCDPKNYRAIAISSCLSKLMHSVLNKRLQEFMITTGLAHQFQGGFTKGRRTTDNILIIRTLIEQATEDKCELWVANLDLRTAYDNINRSLLEKKMKNAGLGSKFRKLVKN